ncbi:MAG: sigma-70 family RNA polymerase sigma factor, partial [Planctomycetes bacterium]|nr:sigma-70 family RNA polymerase sigma factor [Planctomycetota bacterium]
NPTSRNSPHAPSDSVSRCVLQNCLPFSSNNVAIIDLRDEPRGTNSLLTIVFLESICMTDVSQLLEQIHIGDRDAVDRLLNVVYDELRKLAAAQLIREKPGHSLDATALVHEAWLKLVKPDGEISFAHRSHFMAAAANAMRHILVDQARRKQSIKHGGKQRRVPLPEQLADCVTDPEQTLVVDELIERLAAQHSRQADVAKMRLFLNYSLKEIAEIMDLSADTIESDWSFARAWLKREWTQK